MVADPNYKEWWLTPITKEWWLTPITQRMVADPNYSITDQKIN